MSLLEILLVPLHFWYTREEMCVTKILVAPFGSTAPRTPTVWGQRILGVTMAGSKNNHLTNIYIYIYTYILSFSSPTGAAADA